MRGTQRGSIVELCKTNGVLKREKLEKPVRSVTLTGKTLVLNTQVTLSRRFKRKHNTVQTPLVSLTFTQPKVTTHCKPISMIFSTLHAILMNSLDGRPTS